MSQNADLEDQPDLVGQKDLGDLEDIKVLVEKEGIGGNMAHVDLKVKKDHVARRDLKEPPDLKEE